MSHFAAVKIIDINGQIVELNDVSDILEEIRDELKIMNIYLASMTGKEITKEDIEDGS